MLAVAKDAFIQCRVTAATKQALRTAAHRQQLTESALLKQLVELLLQAATPTLNASASSRPNARLVRVYVRLSPGDLGLLKERAAARFVAPATYLSILARAH